MIDMGVIHGRFQVLHNDHLRYLLAGKARCRHLVIGITNPDPTLTRADPSDPHRSLPEANPLSYFERYTMVQHAMVESGMKAATAFSVVPFPINLPELYSHYVPLSGTFFLTIYDPWGRKKLERFKGLGLKTEILWEKPPQDKGLSGVDVRNRMANEDPWEHLVPPSTAALMKAWDVPKRLRKLSLKRT
jgi:nicotinamide-nucleotide adenylyltransferase